MLWFLICFEIQICSCFGNGLFLGPLIHVGGYHDLLIVHGLLLDLWSRIGLWKLEIELGTDLDLVWLFQSFDLVYMSLWH